MSGTAGGSAEVATGVLPAPVRRGRNPEEAILDATLDLLAELGFAGLTVDGIAARAHVGKATIYRRWRSKAELVMHAFGALAEQVPAPDTGDLRRDLCTIVSGLADMLQHSRRARVLTALIDAARHDPEVADLHRQFTAQRRRCSTELLQRAVARGELPAGLDVELTADLLGGPIFYRHLISLQPIDAGFVERLVDAVLAGVRSQASVG